MSAKPSLPLEGLRVLDLSYVFAVPYIGGLMADLGAEVIKVEGPHRLDLTRGIAFARYAENDPGPDPWNRSGVFHVLNRGKKSVVLDLNQAEGRAILSELVKKSDVLLENFTPRVLRKWQLQYEDLKKLKPSLIMLSNTGYGSGGPWSEYPSQGTTLEATMGITNYTGYRDDKPWKVGQSYPDFLATWAGLTALMAAIIHMRRTGLGQWIDLGMYQVGAALLAEPMLQHQIGRATPRRLGNEDEEHVPSNLYPASGEDRWIAITVRNDAQWVKLSELIGQPNLAMDPRFSSCEARRCHREEVNALVADWTRQRDSESTTVLLQHHGIAAGPLLNSRDLLLDAHLKHRRFYERVDHKGTIGTRPMIGRPYRMRFRHPTVQGPGPGFGEHNATVLTELAAMDASAIERLSASKTTSDIPEQPGIAHPWDLQKSMQFKTLVAIDSDYREKLDRACQEGEEGTPRA